MIEIPRALARQFRAVLRRSLMEGRSDWPLVLLRTDATGLTLEAKQGDVAVRYQCDGSHDSEAIEFRTSVLGEFEGHTNDPVLLEQVEFGKGRARWTDGGVPRVIEIATVTPDSVPEFPIVPKRFTAQPAEFLCALDEAARTTARESGRLALSRILLRGRNGELVGTDGKQLLVQRGFDFPWQEDLLVPRMLVFGIRDLFTEGSPIGIGRTDSHVVVRVGSWTFALAIDMSSRFPDVNAVVPKPSAVKSRLSLQAEEAALLAHALSKLPAGPNREAPVTLDLGQPIAVRAKPNDGSGPVVELVLAQATVTGSPLRLHMNRNYLRRALELGFTEVQATVDAPLLCRDERRIFVWMPLTKESAIPPSPDVLRIELADQQPTTNPTKRERRKDPMPNHTPKGTTTENSRAIESSERGVSLAELIEEAEALRAALGDACTRAARLIAALKHQRRRSRALESAVATLRELRLDR